MKVGVISNPYSRRNRRQLAKLSGFLAPYANVIHERTQGVDDVPGALDRLLDGEPDVLVINGGDGTVAEVLTELYLRRTRRPARLMVLAGGTSNTIAVDTGCGGPQIAVMRRLLSLTDAELETTASVVRPVMRVCADDAAAPVAGMFFGTAAICDIVLLRRRMFPQTWIPDSVAAAMTLVRVLAQLALGRAHVLPGREIALARDGMAPAGGVYAVLFATTLNRIVLGATPFWPTESGAIKLTGIASPARGLLANTWRLLYGKDRRKLPADTFSSHAADRIELTMACPFLLDGEFFDPGPNGRVTIDVAGEARFLQVNA